MFQNSEHEDTSSQVTVSKSKPCVEARTSKPDTAVGLSKTTAVPSCAATSFSGVTMDQAAPHALSSVETGTPTAQSEVDFELPDLDRGQFCGNYKLNADAGMPDPKCRVNDQLSADAAMPSPKSCVNGPKCRVNGQLSAKAIPGPSGITTKVNKKCPSSGGTRCASKVEKPMTRQRGKAKRRYVSSEEDNTDGKDSEVDYVPPKMAKKRNSTSKADLGSKSKDHNVRKSKSDIAKERAETKLVDQWKSMFV